MDQQKHLENLIQQKNSLLSEINVLESTLVTKKELMLKVQGAVEYLNQIGIYLNTAEEKNTEETEITEESEKKS